MDILKIFFSDRRGGLLYVFYGMFDTLSHGQVRHPYSLPRVTNNETDEALCMILVLKTKFVSILSCPAGLQHMNIPQAAVVTNKSELVPSYQYLIIPSQNYSYELQDHGH